MSMYLHMLAHASFYPSMLNGVRWTSKQNSLCSIGMVSFVVAGLEWDITLRGRERAHIHCRLLSDKWPSTFRIIARDLCGIVAQMKSPFHVRQNMETFLHEDLVYSKLVSVVLSDTYTLFGQVVFPLLQ